MDRSEKKRSFSLGEELKMSAKGLEAFRHIARRVPYDEKLRGVFLGMDEIGNAVIHRVGSRWSTNETYEPEFWEPV